MRVRVRVRVHLRWFENALHTRISQVVGYGPNPQLQHGGWPETQLWPVGPLRPLRRSISHSLQR